MVRKRDRVIGTLVIWIAVIVVMSKIFDGLNYAPVYLQNNWYYPGGVVVGENTEMAMQIYADLQSIGSNLFTQTQQMARAELFNYFLPYILLIVVALLIGAVLSTLFIWRSVIVPASTSEAIAASARKHERDEQRPVTTLLDDDGELIEPVADPTHNHRGK